LPLPQDVAQIFSDGPYRDLPYHPALLQLEEEMDNSITQLVQDNKLASRRVFVRLSTRSPKDAPLMNDELIDKYIVQGLVDTVTDWEDRNLICHVIWSSMAKAMQVTTAKEAIRLFLQSSRVRDDCKRELARDELYDMKIIIREWVDVPIKYEFRSFITDRRINCITQYFDNCLFTGVIENHSKIMSNIISLWDQVKDKVQFSHGIVDFALSEDLQKTYIIECNPLDIFTGPALFHYTQDWDVITGKAPFEFRFITEITEKVANDQLGNEISFKPEIDKAKQKQRLLAEKRRIEKEKQSQICSIM